jgi:hypothetical protein
MGGGFNGIEPGSSDGWEISVTDALETRMANEITGKVAGKYTTH